ncbi:MAG: hypothetical protein J6A85_02225 [Clostridia bacterium]|nr:hypothetical protein [Clostridia bacterium]
MVTSNDMSQSIEESEIDESYSDKAEESAPEASAPDESEPDESVPEVSLPNEENIPEESDAVAENTEPKENDGWDFLKGLQVFGGCMSDSSDAAVHPFVDGFLEATTRYYQYEENLDLLYPVKIIVFRYTDINSAYDLPRSSKLLNEVEFKQFEDWLGATDLKYRAKTENTHVYPEDKNTEEYIVEYTFIHTELSADDMNELVELGKEKGYRLNILFCADDECLEGKDVYYPDGCVWHDCYEDFGKEIPEDCFNKK